MANPTKIATMAVAKKLQGTREEPMGSNRTWINKWFYGRMVAAAWCAITVCYILIVAGWKIRKNAGSLELGQDLLDKGWKRIAPRDIVGGDVVVYNFRHIGYCWASLSPTRKRVWEGNHGDRYGAVDRPIGDIDYGVRPPYAPEKASVTPTTVVGGTSYRCAKVYGVHTGPSKTEKGEGKINIGDVFVSDHGVVRGGWAKGHVYSASPHVLYYPLTDLRTR